MKKKTSFKEVIRGSKPVLVDFSAEWCGPCKAMAPILKEVAAEMKGRARVIKIDVDKNRILAMKYNISSVPTLIVFQKGKVRWRHSGMVSAYHLKEILTRELAEAS